MYRRARCYCWIVYDHLSRACGVWTRQNTYAVQCRSHLKGKESNIVRSISSHSFASFLHLCVPFSRVAPSFFQEKYNITQESANNYLSIPYLLSCGLSPLFGFLIDKVGRNLLWIGSSVLIMLVSHSLITFTFVSPIFVMVLFGTGYSMLASSLWPLISFCVEPKYLGTAFGLVQAVQNFGLGMVGILTGWIVDGYGFLWCQQLYMGLLSVTLLLAVCLYVVDLNSGRVLNRSAKLRAEEEEAKKKDEAK